MILHCSRGDNLANNISKRGTAQVGAPLKIHKNMQSYLKYAKKHYCENVTKFTVVENNRRDTHEIKERFFPY